MWRRFLLLNWGFLSWWHTSRVSAKRWSSIYLQFPQIRPLNWVYQFKWFTRGLHRIQRSGDDVAPTGLSDVTVYSKVWCATPMSGYSCMKTSHKTRDWCYTVTSHWSADASRDVVCISPPTRLHDVFVGDMPNCSEASYRAIGVGDGAGPGPGTCPLKFGKNCFRAIFLCKIRVFFGQKSCKIREFC